MCAHAPIQSIVHFCHSHTEEKKSQIQPYTYWAKCRMPNTCTCVRWCYTTHMHINNNNVCTSYTVHAEPLSWELSSDGSAAASSQPLLVRTYPRVHVCICMCWIRLSMYFETSLCSVCTHLSIHVYGIYMHTHSCEPLPHVCFHCIRSHRFNFWLCICVVSLKWMKEEDKHKTTAHFFHTYDRRIFSSLRSPLGKSAFITHRPLKRVQTKKTHQQHRFI